MFAQPNCFLHIWMMAYRCVKIQVISWLLVAWDESGRPQEDIPYLQGDAVVLVIAGR